MKDFSTTLIPCSQINSIIRSGKKLNPKRLQKLNELLQSEATLTGDDPFRLEMLLAEQDSLDTLSKTAKTFLIRRYVIEKYYRDYEATPLQLVKGIKAETNSLQFYCSVTGEKHKKNKKKYENDFLIGTPDVVEGDLVIEVKSSWDIFTYLKNVNNDVNIQYYWQLQGYLSITGKKNAELVYCLVSTPDEIIEEEYARIFAKNPSISDTNKRKELYDSLYFNMRFDDIPKEERILRFTVERNDRDIDRIHKKVKQCREFLLEFQERHLFFTKHHRKSILNSLKAEVEDGSSED